MRVNRFQTLAVKGSAARRAAERQANRDGAGDIRAPKKRRSLVYDLVERHRGKIRELHFDDWPHAFNRRADGETNHRVFADGRIQNATGKFLLQIFCGLERAAERTDVLPVNKYARIVAQGVGLRFADGFEIGDAHRKLRFFPQFVQMFRGQRAPFFLIRIGRGFALRLRHGFLDFADGLAAPDGDLRGVGKFFFQQKILGDF